MLIKECDSREYDVLVLEVLAQDAALAGSERHQVLQALRTMRARQVRRRTLATQLDSLLGARDDWIVLHDLRLWQKDKVIEIDHLLINCLMQAWVLDASCFDLQLTITSFGELLTHTGGTDKASQSEEASGDFQERLLTPSPLLAITEHRRLFRDWLDVSGLLPLRMGMTLQPQLLYRVVIADESQASRPPEDIVDSRALVSMSRLRRQCLQVSGRTASITRLRSFTHRIDKRRLRRLGRAIAAQHVTSTIDWPVRLGLSPDTQESSRGVSADGAASAYRWVPAALSASSVEHSDSVTAQPTDQGAGSGQAFADLPMSALKSLSSAPKAVESHPFESRGLQAAHWGQPSHAGDDREIETDIEAIEGDGSLGKHMQGPSRDIEGLPRCDGCRRWLSKDSIVLCQQSNQSEALCGRLLCERCREQL